MIGLTSSRDEAFRVLAAWLRGPRAPSLARSAPAPLVLFLCRSNTALSIMAGCEIDVRAAFEAAFATLDVRIRQFLALPLEQLNGRALAQEVQRVGEGL